MIKVQKQKRFCWLLMALLIQTPVDWLRSATTNLLPVADTRLTSQNPESNEGSSIEFVAGTQGTLAGNARNRAVIKFNPAAVIPSGAVITSARLTVTVTKSPNLTLFQFDLRRVLKPWAENEATWMIRLAPDVAWDAPGGSIGTDFSQTVSASQMIGGTTPSPAYTFGSTTGLVADVQSWLNNPGANFGWVLMTSDEEEAFSARRFGAREHPNFPPLLEVQYMFPPRIDLVDRTGNNINLHFTAEATYCYAVEFRNSLSEGSWATLTNVCEKLVAQNVVVSDSLSASTNRFYRLLRTPCFCR